MPPKKTIPAAAPKPAPKPVVSLRCIAPGDHWVTIQGRVCRDDGSPLFKADASFHRVPGLADKDCVTFESVSHPGMYLRHQDYKLKVMPNDGTRLFRSDATFREHVGLHRGEYNSFECYAPANHFIRHQNYDLWVHPEEEDNPRYCRDATFEVKRGPPL
jgi:hypothetical protein